MPANVFRVDDTSTPQSIWEDHVANHRVRHPTNGVMCSFRRFSFSLGPDSHMEFKIYSLFLTRGSPNSTFRAPVPLRHTIQRTHFMAGHIADEKYAVCAPHGLNAEINARAMTQGVYVSTTYINHRIRWFLPSLPCQYYAHYNEPGFEGVPRYWAFHEENTHWMPEFFPGGRLWTDTITPSILSVIQALGNHRPISTPPGRPRENTTIHTLGDRYVRIHPGSPLSATMFRKTIVLSKQDSIRKYLDDLENIMSVYCSGECSPNEELLSTTPAYQYGQLVQHIEENQQRLNSLPGVGQGLETNDILFFLPRRMGVLYNGTYVSPVAYQWPLPATLVSFPSHALTSGKISMKPRVMPIENYPSVGNRNFQSGRWWPHDMGGTSFCFGTFYDNAKWLPIETGIPLLLSILSSTDHGNHQYYNRWVKPTEEEAQAALAFYTKYPIPSHVQAIADVFGVAPSAMPEVFPDHLVQIEEVTRVEEEDNQNDDDDVEEDDDEANEADDGTDTEREVPARGVFRLGAR